MGTQQYCLRWNNHHTNFQLTFDQLLQTEAFTDVTLACDGTSVKCHKMVLAACSSYFQSLFMENSCTHPIVILKDIKYNELRTILEFMYKGEVNIMQEDLAALLKLAETLKIKGLVDEAKGQFSALLGAVKSNSSQNELNAQSISNDSLSQISSSNGHIASCASISNMVVSSNFPLIQPKTNSQELKSKFQYSALLKSLNVKRRAKSVEKEPSTPPVTTSIELNNNSTKCQDIQKPGIATSPSSQHPILRTVLGNNVSNGLEKHDIVDDDTDLKPDLNLVSPLSTIDQEESKAVKNEPDSEDDFSSYDGSHVEIGSSCIQPSLPNNNQVSSKELPCKSGRYSGGKWRPEWKRYKLYGNADLEAAIDEVRAGVSTPAAARKYGIPSRTLYAKMKKLGISTGPRKHHMGKIIIKVPKPNLNNESGPDHCEEDHDNEFSRSHDTHDDCSFLGALKLRSRQDSVETSSSGKYDRSFDKLSEDDHSDEDDSVDHMVIDEENRVETFDHVVLDERNRVGTTN